MTDFVTLPSNTVWTDPSTPWPQRPAWQSDASCRSLTPDLFFTEGPGENVTAAKRVCAGCEVRAACLEYALDLNERTGVWGGMSVTERDAERRRRGTLRRPGGAVPAGRRAQVASMRRDGQTITAIAREIGTTPRSVHRWLGGDQ